MHPEEFGLCYPQNSKASDVYAFGMLAWEASVSMGYFKLFARMTSVGFYWTCHVS